MRRTLKLLIALACLGTLAAVIALLVCDDEPHYNGRSLSEWLRPEPGKPTERKLSAEAQTAIRHIGTNALPTILHWISYEAKPRQKDIHKFRQRYLGFVRPSVDTGELRANDAVRVFSVLGGEARSSIPELVHLADTSTQGSGRIRRCIDALYHIGPDAIPAITTMITNTEFRFRFYAVFGTRRLGTNISVLTPLLLSLLDDKDDRVACAAAENLSLLRISPSNTVPGLCAMLESTNSDRRLYAVRGLIQFGSEARVAVPQLQGALADPSVPVRQQAVIALRIIAPEVSTNASSQ